MLSTQLIFGLNSSKKCSGLMLCTLEDKDIFCCLAWLFNDRCLMIWSIASDRVDTLQDRQADFFESCKNFKAGESETQFTQVTFNKISVVEELPHLSQKTNTSPVWWTLLKIIHSWTPFSSLTSLLTPMTSAVNNCSNKKWESFSQSW